MEIIMHGDFVAGNATSMGSPSNMRDVSHDDPVPQGGGLHQSPEPEPMRSRRDIYMLLGSGMTLLAGIFAIINGLRGLFSDIHTVEYRFAPYDYCATLFVLFGIIAVAGGISGIMRKSFLLAVAGAIMGMMGGGVYGLYLGLGALILFGLSNQDMTS